MKVTPKDWNVIVAGQWNPAILSPSGIGKHLLGLPEETVMEVQVPLNVIAPPMVKHQALKIIPDYKQLRIDAVNNDLAGLGESRSIAVKALETLPLTPVVAAGYNIRYRIQSPEPNFFELIACPFDIVLSNNTFVIKSRNIRRSLEWKDGRINLHISKQESDSEYEIAFNFHRESLKVQDLVDWLKISLDEAKDVSDKLMHLLLGTWEEEEIGDQGT